MKVLITGATSGIGKCIAEKLSNRGWELILTGRNEDMLKSMQERLGKCEIIAADLSQKSEVLKVYDFCREKNVDMLVNNAGFGVFGRLSETDLDKELEMINVNIRAVHILMKLFLRDFRKRDKGIILNVASSAGFLTGPLMAAYYASKSYVIKLSHAAAEELRREGSRVKVSVFCPGPVETDFNNRAGVTFSMKPISADFAAEYAIKCALSGKLTAVPGLFTSLGLLGAKFLPNKLVAAVVYEMQERKKDV